MKRHAHRENRWELALFPVGILVIIFLVVILEGAPL